MRRQPAVESHAARIKELLPKRNLRHRKTNVDCRSAQLGLAALGTRQRVFHPAMYTTRGESEPEVPVDQVDELNNGVLESDIDT